MSAKSCGISQLGADQAGVGLLAFNLQCLTANELGFRSQWSPDLHPDLFAGLGISQEAPVQLQWKTVAGFSKIVASGA
jgi:hypothetical protein